AGGSRRAGRGDPPPRGRPGAARAPVARRGGDRRVVPAGARLRRAGASPAASGRMRVLVVSGIWPPDVGGPASHAPQVADELHARGHRVEVVTTAVREPSPRAYRVSWVSRALPRGVLHAAVVALVARRPRAADVAYATSM